MLESKAFNNAMNLHELTESPGKENNPLLGSATFNMSVMSKKLEEVTVSSKPTESAKPAVIKVFNKASTTIIKNQRQAVNSRSNPRTAVAKPKATSKEPKPAAAI
jgi:hypothetical protein